MNDMSPVVALPMPPEIAKAVIAVMREVKKLSRDGNNTFARYKFTSVDQFFEALGPLMAANSLMDVAHEISTEISIREVVDDKGQLRKSAWLTAVYHFWLFHDSGVSYGPIKRTQQAQATGAQSYATVQSFAEKYFLRNLFKIPTGDMDEVDASQQHGLPTAPPPPPNVELKPDPRRLNPNWTRIKFTFSACNDVTELAEKQRLAETLWHFTQEDKDELNRLAAERVKQLATPEVWAEGRE